MVRGSYPSFGKDEVVLCFHGDIMYDAKILDIRQSDPDDRRSVREYRVHYKGWKSTWDDWVTPDRLRKFTEENRELAETLKNEAEAAMRKPPKSSAKKKAAEKQAARGTEDGRSTAPAKGTKRGRDTETEKEEQFNARPSVRIVLPDTLKSLLVDDWENITKNLQIVGLPAIAPVNKLLEWYVEDEKPNRTDAAEVDILEEVISGLKEYFEKAIGRILLYFQERDQYRFYREKLEKGGKEWENKTMSDIYGAEHMARLLAIMPELLGQTNMSQQSTHRVREEVSKFAIWLSRNSEKFFASKYHSPANTFLNSVPKEGGSGTATSGLIGTEERV